MANSSETHNANHLKDSSSPNEFINNFINNPTEPSFLKNIISTPGPTEEDMTEGDIFALLKQLEAADGVAQGVESKLDKLLKNIEGLLEGLEESGEVQPDRGASESNLDTSGTTKPGHA